MPTYQYLCSSCQHQFELYQSFSDVAITVCPECKKETVAKIISGGAGVMFKGGGFYETDYKRGKGSDYANKSDVESGKSKPDKEGFKSDTPKTETPKTEVKKSSSEPSSSSKAKSD